MQPSVIALPVRVLDEQILWRSLPSLAIEMAFGPLLADHPAVEQTNQKVDRPDLSANSN